MEIFLNDFLQIQDVVCFTSSRQAEVINWKLLFFFLRWETKVCIIVADIITSFVICFSFSTSNLTEGWITLPRPFFYTYIHTHTCPSKTVDTLSWAESIKQKANLKINLMMWPRMAKYLIQNIVGVAPFFFNFFFWRGAREASPGGCLISALPLCFRFVLTMQLL